MLHLCGGGGDGFSTRDPLDCRAGRNARVPGLPHGWLRGTYGDKPAYPVLWALTEAYNVPWGRAVVIE